MATIYSGSESDLLFLAKVLRDGGLVAVPTETVYGLAAHALDAAACRRIFEIKGRPAHDPLIVHVASRAAADAVAELNETAETLAKRFWPGALTLVLPKKDAVPEVVTSGRKTVAVRVPAHPLMRALLERSGLPLAAPSANPFGYVSPTSAAHVQENLGAQLEHILDGGPCAIGLESTIVDVRNENDPVILRPGGIAREEIERALGRAVRVQQRAEKTTAVLAPGMLDRHYSPRTRVTLRETEFAADAHEHRADDIALVYFLRPARLAAPSPARGVYWLSGCGDLAEAAQRLFALLRELDAAGFREIVFEPAPSHGLGLAINDRLRRAAARE